MQTTLMTMLAHVTPQEAPAGILLFVAGMVVGTLLTFAVMKLRAR
ncbi:MAG: hypothetical protein SH868_14125 [Bythopirellula sp.]|nr:hypothetical protein [Bythopirellula sp.]